MHGADFSWFNFVFQNKPTWFTLDQVGYFVKAQGLTMVLGATLFIANTKAGGFIVAVSVLL